MTQNIIQPAIRGLNHLIDGGGLGDYQSAPSDARLLPKSHSKAFLEDLRQGFKAVFWDKAAESLEESTPSKAASWKLESSKAAIGAKMGLARSWGHDRLIEAGFSQGVAIKQATENDPNEARCKLGIQIMDATAAAIGWGVGCHARVDKARLASVRGTLLKDMTMVYNNKIFDPKKMQKLPLKTLMGANDPEKDLDWMRSADWTMGAKEIKI